MKKQILKQAGLKFEGLMLKAALSLPACDSQIAYKNPHLFNLLVWRKYCELVVESNLQAA